MLCAASAVRFALTMSEQPTAPAACASPDGASPQPPPPTTAAGAQTARAVVAVAHGDGSYPETVTVTVDGVVHLVDVSVDRDDWQLPEVDAAIAHLVLSAIDDAVAAFDDGFEATAKERMWARCDARIARAS